MKEFLVRDFLAEAVNELRKEQRAASEQGTDSTSSMSREIYAAISSYREIGGESSEAASGELYTCDPSGRGVASGVGLG